MGAHVYATDLTPKRLIELLTELRPEAPFAILERIDGLEFPGPGALPNVAAWDKGWLFGPALELRWERRGPALRTVLTLPDGRQAGEEFGEPVESLPAGEMCEYYLWGEDDPSIGRRLNYQALAAGGRAKLVVEEFRDPESFVLLFYRYAGMRREE
jgi:hypothetical protein